MHRQHWECDRGWTGPHNLSVRVPSPAGPENREALGLDVKRQVWVPVCIFICVHMSVCMLQVLVYARIRICVYMGMCVKKGSIAFCRFLKRS